MPLGRRSSTPFAAFENIAFPRLRIVCKQIPRVERISYRTLPYWESSRHSPVDWTLSSSGSHRVHLRSVHLASQGQQPRPRPRPLHLAPSLTTLHPTPHRLAPSPTPPISPHLTSSRHTCLTTTPGPPPPPPRVPPHDDVRIRQPPRPLFRAPAETRRNDRADRPVRAGEDEEDADGYGGGVSGLSEQVSGAWGVGSGTWGLMCVRLWSEGLSVWAKASQVGYGSGRSEVCERESHETRG